MEEILNNEIREWWKKLPDNLRTNMPTFIHPINKDAEILFVGLNPSGTHTTTEPIADITSEDIQQKIEVEKRFIFGDPETDREGQYKRYYGVLSTIADELGVAFEHYDLFQMSLRKSKTILNELFEKKGKLKAQHEKHLSIFEKVLECVNPSVVVANNVNTANILKKKKNLVFDNETGLYKDDKGMYYSLNGIMSYGRQTIFDRERLIWQLRKVIKK